MHFPIIIPAFILSHHVNRRSGFSLPYNIDLADGILDNRYSPLYTGQGVNVYILDSGVDFTHQVFSGVTWRHGPSFADDNATNPHGTYVASIVAQLSPHARLISVRVFSGDGRGAIDWLLAALAWVKRDCLVPQKCLVNFSGISPYMIKINAMVAALSPIRIVAAAGNFGRDASGLLHASPFANAQVFTWMLDQVHCCCI
jgi:subtilisin family serine protease